MIKRLSVAALAAISFATCVYAQSDASEPLATPVGTLHFTRVDREYIAMLDNETIDRFSASTLVHFDDVGDANDTSDTVTRVLVQTESGPVLYDLRHRPALVLRLGRRMTIKRVFWQGDEVVMQGSEGWFRFNHGVLTKLQSTTTIYH